MICIKIKTDENGNILKYQTVDKPEPDYVTSFPHKTILDDLKDEYGNYRYSLKDGKIIENTITLTSEQEKIRDAKKISYRVDEAMYKIAIGEITDFISLKDFLNGE